MGTQKHPFSLSRKHVRKALWLPMHPFHALDGSAARVASRVRSIFLGQSLAFFIMLLKGDNFSFTPEGKNFKHPVVVAAIQPSNTWQATYKHPVILKLLQKRHEGILSADVLTTGKKEITEDVSVQRANVHEQRAVEAGIQPGLLVHAVGDGAAEGTSNVIADHHLSEDASRLRRRRPTSGMKWRERTGDTYGNASNSFSSVSIPSLSLTALTRLHSSGGSTTQTISSKASGGTGSFCESEHLVSSSVVPRSTRTINDMFHQNCSPSDSSSLRGAYTGATAMPPLSERLQTGRMSAVGKSLQTTSTRATNGTGPTPQFAVYTATRHLETSNSPRHVESDTRDMGHGLLQITDRSSQRNITKLSSQNPAESGSYMVTITQEDPCVQICRVRSREKTSGTDFRTVHKSDARALSSTAEGPLSPGDKISTSDILSPVAPTTSTMTGAASQKMLSVSGTPEKKRRSMVRRHTSREQSFSVRKDRGVRRAKSLTPVQSRNRGRHTQRVERLDATAREATAKQQGRAAESLQSRTSQDRDWFSKYKGIHTVRCDCLTMDDGAHRVQTLSDGWGSFTLLAIAGFVACVAFFVAILLICWHMTMQPMLPTVVVEADPTGIEQRRRPREARHAVTTMSSGRRQPTAGEAVDWRPYLSNPPGRRNVLYKAPTRIFFAVDNCRDVNPHSSTKDDGKMARQSRDLLRESPDPISPRKTDHSRPAPVAEPHSPEPSGEIVECSFSQDEDEP